MQVASPTGQQPGANTRGQGATGAERRHGIEVEGTHFETGSRLAQAALLLWMMTTILYLACDKSRIRNDENPSGYAPDCRPEPETERTGR